MGLDVGAGMLSGSSPSVKESCQGGGGQVQAGWVQSWPLHGEGAGGKVRECVCSKPLSVAPSISSFQIRDTQIRLPGAHTFWVVPKFS